jgi:hypothetical protein
VQRRIASSPQWPFQDKPPSGPRRAIDVKLLIPFSAVNGVKYFMAFVEEEPARVGKDLTRESETIYDRYSVPKKIRANESRGRKESQEGALSRFRLSPE